MEPAFSYRANCNVITFDIKRGKRISALIWVIVSLMLGIILGAVSRRFPAVDVKDFYDSYMAPVSKAFMGMVSGIAGIPVFVSLVSGISQFGDITAFNKVGKRIISRIVTTFIFVYAAFAAVMFFIFMPQTSGAHGFDFKSLWQMIVGLIPTNPIAAFLNGNVLQIIVLAVLGGIVILTVSNKTASVADSAKQLNLLIGEIMALVIKAVPIVIFFNVFEMAALGDYSVIIGLRKPLVLQLILVLLPSVIYAVKLCIKTKTRFALIVKKMFPLMLIAFTTASSSASFTTAIETQEKSFGTSGNIVKLGVPLYESFCKPLMALEFSLYSLYLMKLYDVKITLSAFITVIITAAVLAIATPPITGGSASCYSLMLLQCGIPIEALSVLLAINVFVDRITTTGAEIFNQLGMLDTGLALDKADVDVLRKADSRNRKSAV